MKLVKYLTGTVLLVALLVIGLLMGVRSCLSKYDERSALLPVLYFEKGNKAVFFSLVKLGIVTSYEERRGFTSKTISNEYYVQCNDAVTGQKIKKRKIDVPGHLKNYPIEVLGAANNNAWIFADGLMAFDALALQQVAATKDIEDKNPSLKGMLPADKRFYHFDTASKNINITINDGTVMVLNTTSLLMSPQVAMPDEKTGRLSFSEKDAQAVLQNLQGKRLDYSAMFVNQDTMNGHWHGLYSGNELQGINGHITISSANTNNERRQFFTSLYTAAAVNNLSFDKATVNNLPAIYFLDGGFLLNRQTGKLIRPSINSYIIIYKNKIDTDGTIMLCLLENNALMWKINTGLTQCMDWHFNGNQLSLFGSNKVSLANRQCDIFLAIGIKDGAVSKFDYSADKSTQ